jgi:hypothetical protein
VRGFRLELCNAHVQGSYGCNFQILLLPSFCNLDLVLISFPLFKEISWMIFVKITAPQISGALKIWLISGLE